MNIHAIGHARSSGYYRLKIPYMTLANAGRGHRLMLNYLPDLTLVEADILVVHKPYLPELLAYLENPRTFPVITDLDDLLWAPPPWNDAQRAWQTHPDWRRTLVRFLRESDHVTTSTERLKVEIGKIAPHQQVTVLPNMLDLSTFREPFGVRQQGVVTIGWYGSKSHIGPDLSSIVGILPQACGGSPLVRLRIIGPDTLAQIPQLTRGFPPDQITLRPWVAPDQLPMELAALDIGLAPLTDDAWNACKSDLKPLEYAAAGVWPIFSDVPAYRQVPVGRRCRTSGDWIHALRSAVEHIPVINKSWPSSRSILHHLDAWEQMLKEVIDAYSHARRS